jgi:hypothetical protein
LPLWRGHEKLVAVPTAEPLYGQQTAAKRRYLDETVRTWLGLPASAEVETPRLPGRLERRFLRIEEYERVSRDPWGCWDHTYSENFQDGTLNVPEVDHWLVRKREELGRTERLEQLWPAGKAFAVCLTHDVDVLTARSTPRQVLRHAVAGLDRGGAQHDRLRYLRPPVRGVRALRAGLSRSPSTVATLELSLGLEARYGAASSYFFAVPAGGRGSRYDCTYAPSDRCTFRGVRTTVAEMIRTIAGDGTDVGLHGSYYSAIVTGVLAAERATLEHATGIVATTTRQHFLHWDVNRTPQIQVDAGFRADSSLGFNRTVGYRASTTLPWRQFDVARDRALPLLEVPLVVEDSALLGPIAAGRGLEAAQARVVETIDTAHSVGGAVTLLFHPDKLVRPDWLALYESSLSYAAERGGWLTSLAELERWWTAREQKLLAT